MRRRECGGIGASARFAALAELDQHAVSFGFAVEVAGVHAGATGARPPWTCSFREQAQVPPWPPYQWCGIGNWERA